MASEDRVDFPFVHVAVGDILTIEVFLAQDSRSVMYQLDKAFD
jgi:hypothetical protein